MDDSESHILWRIIFDMRNDDGLFQVGVMGTERSGRFIETFQR